MEDEMPETKPRPSRDGAGGWAHCEESDQNPTERWSNLHKSREEAIADGRMRYDGAPYYVQHFTGVDPRRVVPTPDEIVLLMAGMAYDKFGCDDAKPSVDARGKEALERLLEQWADTHVAVCCYEPEGEPERCDLAVQP
jgi:hypothetical protein